MPQGNSKSFNNRPVRWHLMSSSTVRSNLLIGFTSVILASCSAPAPQKVATPTATNDQQPVLQVKQASYTFSMYPQYMKEGLSLLKLNIRDKDGAFVSGVRAVASLRAKDGDTAKVSFKEDQNIHRYVAEVALKHHEDYVIEADMQMPGSASTSFVAGFSFHCGDALPQDIHSEQPQPTEGSSLK
ncbi:MAG: hypothetical protein K2X29_06950 [Candidatus Obscuribacterales bacterium]|nr:hypothetical protein [Candidatus Obscuribacterales bacterium]